MLVFVQNNNNEILFSSKHISSQKPCLKIVYFITEYALDTTVNSYLLKMYNWCLINK